eukprot:1545533-Prymnesium_polylepis.2
MRMTSAAPPYPAHGPFRLFAAATAPPLPTSHAPSLRCARPGQTRNGRGRKNTIFASAAMTHASRRRSRSRRGA